MILLNPNNYEHFTGKGYNSWLAFFKKVHFGDVVTVVDCSDKLRFYKGYLVDEHEFEIICNRIGKDSRNFK
jgi:hypothetical protein